MAARCCMLSDPQILRSSRKVRGNYDLDCSSGCIDASSGCKSETIKPITHWVAGLSLHYNVSSSSLNHKGAASGRR